MMHTEIGAGMTLAEISEFISKHTHNTQVVNTFYGVPATSKLTLSAIDIFIARQITLNIIVIHFFGKIPLTDLTLAEIKSAVNKQKLIKEIIGKFFEDSKPGDITTNISDIDKYVRDRDQLRNRSLLIPFFFNKEANRIMTDNEIKTNYLDIYNDIFGLKEDFKNIQKPINDVVGKFFGTPLVAGMTLAEISEFIIRHTQSANFFGTPATSTMTLKDISIFMTRQLLLSNIVNNF